jgi:DeoR family glycerol-3-phosphate regulon repressor
MDYALEEAEFARLVLSRGERRVVVTDHSKFGRRGLISVAGFDEVGEVITDRAPEAAIAGRLASAGARLVLAG